MKTEIIMAKEIEELRNENEGLKLLLDANYGDGIIEALILKTKKKLKLENKLDSLIDEARELVTKRNSYLEKRLLNKYFIKLVEKLAEEKKSKTRTKTEMNIDG